MEVIDLTSDTDTPRLPRVRRPRPIPDDPELVVVTEKLKHAPKLPDAALPRNPSTPTSSKRPRQKTTEAPQVVAQKKGIKPLEDYPHARFACTQHPYSSETARQFCPKCFCFVCDMLASTCKEWEHHCNAVDTEEWKCKRREHRKATRRYERGVDLLAKEARRREKRSRKEKERREVLEALGEPITLAELMAEQMEAVSEFYRGMVANSDHLVTPPNQQNQQTQQSQAQTSFPAPAPQDGAQHGGEGQLTTNPLPLPPLTMRNPSSAAPRLPFSPATPQANNAPAVTRQAQPCCAKHSAASALLRHNDTNEASGAELARLSNVFLSFKHDHPDGFGVGQATEEQRPPALNNALGRTEATRRFRKLERLYGDRDRRNSQHVETPPSGRQLTRLPSIPRPVRRKEKRSKHRQRVRSRSRLKKSDDQ